MRKHSDLPNVHYNYKFDVCGRMHENLWTCVGVLGYASILIYTHTVYMCVLAGDSESVRVLCFSVCQFHFVSYD